MRPPGNEGSYFDGRSCTRLIYGLCLFRKPEDGNSGSAPSRGSRARAETSSWAAARRSVLCSWGGLLFTIVTGGASLSQPVICLFRHPSQRGSLVRQKASDELFERQGRHRWLSSFSSFRQPPHRQSHWYSSRQQGCWHLGRTSPSRNKLVADKKKDWCYSLSNERGRVQSSMARRGNCGRCQRRKGRRERRQQMSSRLGFYGSEGAGWPFFLTVDIC